MKKLFFSVLLAMVMFLGNSIVFSQPVRFTLTEGDSCVNRSHDRLGPDIWIDVNMANDLLVDSISCKVLTRSSYQSIRTHIIPAQPVRSDGSTDPEKWTVDTTMINDTISRFLMVCNGSTNYWSKSAVSRKIMEFYDGFYGDIPPYGTITITFYDITVVVVNPDGSLSKISLPDISITINLGDPPQPQTDSVFVRVTPTVDKNLRQVKLMFDYQSGFYPIENVSFRLTAPIGFSSPRLQLAETTGRSGSIEQVGNYYLVSLTGVNLLPTNDDYSPLMNITWDYTASGVVNLFGSNVIITGQGGPLPTETSFMVTVDLGQPPPPRYDTTFFRAEYLVDRLKQEVRVDLSYRGKGWDKIILDLNLPQGLYLKKVEVGLLSMTYRLNGSHIEIVSQYLLPDAPLREWYHIASIVLGYYDQNISGWKRLMLENIFLTRHDSTIIVGNQPIIVDIDFNFTGVEDKLPPEPTDTAYVCGLYLYYRIFSSNWTLSIHDYLGRPIIAKTGTVGEGSVNLENLQYGLYFYSLTIGNKIITSKFFIY